MIAAVIRWSARNVFVVVLATILVALAGIYAVQKVPVDAIPDLSDVQVIVFTEYPGQAPQVVEDQVTYPLTTAMLSVPKARVVRGFSYFGVSFVYVIFEDGTDIYWARSRVLEYLSAASRDLPQGVTPELGPDATGVGWVYQYVLRGIQKSLAELRTLQDWYVRFGLAKTPGVAEVASAGGFVKQYSVVVDPRRLQALNIPLSRIGEVIKQSNMDVGGRTIELAEHEYMVDGRAGDKFILSNTVDGTDLDFEAGPGSTLALDVFLDGPASPADNFFIQGNVSGQTAVVVNNTNVGPGTFNPQGIPVIFVDGNTPSALDFQLQDGPIDTGFFDYDLFFVPTNSGFWELRSFTGAGAFLLPQLVTAAQDIWHQGSNAWFDRTADLRVLLAGGLAPTAYNPVGSKSFEAAGPYPLTPAVWARGSGGWLDRDDSAKTRAHGRNYSFDLDRELTTLDFQVGVDLGKRDVMNEGDALVFGMLGGFVYGGLDYDAIPRSFDFSGGQVGAYATYLNGGLFVDTLLNVHLYELSTATRGFPSSLDANTVGLRTDAGYRFGSFTGGAFLEPLATIEVLWADIDGFSLGGNTVSFDDDANVRGRLGLRAGTTMEAWEGTLMEPFVIGSVWGNLSDDNSATLVSNGRTFSFQDDLEDVWGEISGGVNFFNFSQTTAVFAKVDVTVGNDISGVGGKAGMRVNW